MITSLKGQQFGLLFVVDIAIGLRQANQLVWVCRCNCGKIINVRTSLLKSGHRQSCGCSAIGSEESRARQRANYKKHAAKLRESARLNRIKVKADPVRLEAYRKYCREKTVARFKTDINFKLKFRIRGRIWGALKRGVMKQGGTTELLGCSIQQLRKHIESHWAPGMSWDNYGKKGWHIDHIVPCVEFDLTKKREQKACFNYTNLRPLWYLDNLSKGARHMRQQMMDL